MPLFRPNKPISSIALPIGTFEPDARGLFDLPFDAATIQAFKDHGIDLVVENDPGPLPEPAPPAPTEAEAAMAEMAERLRVAEARNATLEAQLAAATQPLVHAAPAQTSEPGAPPPPEGQDAAAALAAAVAETAAKKTAGKAKS